MDFIPVVWTITDWVARVVDLPAVEREAIQYSRSCYWGRDLVHFRHLESDARVAGTFTEYSDYDGPAGLKIDESRLLTAKFAALSLSPSLPPPSLSDIAFAHRLVGMFSLSFLLIDHWKRQTPKCYLGPLFGCP